MMCDTRVPGGDLAGTAADPPAENHVGGSRFRDGAIDQIPSGSPGPGVLLVVAARLSALEPPAPPTPFSTDELDRARRFAFEADRQRFLGARLLLRRLLARLTTMRSGDVAFDTGPEGKPHLRGCTAGAGLHFNVSHAGDVVLVAIGRAGPVGVDVECVRPIDDLDAVAQGFLSLAERQALSAIPAARRPAAFLRCWTRKEAVVKALGSGLQVPLDAFDVSIDEVAWPALRFAAGLRADGPWSLAHVEPWPAVVGAVAARYAVTRLDAVRLVPYDGESGRRTQ